MIEVNNKNKRISELRKRDVITSYSFNSWIPIAQYNSRTNSYHNIAISIGSITSYCNSYATNSLNNEISKLDNKYKELESLTYLDNIDDLSYYINNSNIASAIVSYSFTYNIDYFEWQML